MARPRTEPAETRRRRILEAARHLLVRKEYDDIVLTDVARQAGLAKGTLYLYFRSKDHLISAVMQDIMERLQDQVSACAADGDPIRTLRAYAEVHLRFMDENHDFMTQVLRQDPVLGRSRTSPLRAAVDHHLEEVSRMIRAAIARGALRRYDPLMAAFYFLTLLRMFMVRKVLTRAQAPLGERVNEFMDLFLNGLGGRKR